MLIFQNCMVGLHCIMQLGLDIRKLLRNFFNENIDVNCKEKKYGFTPLHFVRDRWYAGIMDKFSQHNRMQVPDRRTELHIASTLSILLKFQADPRCQSENLHVLKIAGDTEMLLDEDCSLINEKNKVFSLPF
ncbi:hypothetical protein CHS0354_026440 [Potamilus streckersoni]|uniref:Uncharacterized protein n=1 Tax=Potamilus streckersoni TaxID=2493646 RepID=A0AAE0RQ03_9BIVA|nr:hypothetical protein CHS0354_026440 [Potamilus streckersoni]